MIPSAWESRPSPLSGSPTLRERVMLIRKVKALKANFPHDVIIASAMSC